MPDVTTVVAPDDDDEDDESEESTISSEPTDVPDSESDPSASDHTSGYVPDAVIETIVTGSELTDDDVGPVVAQVSDRIDGLTHDQAVETVMVLLDAELGEEEASTEATPEAEADPDDSPSEAAAATSDTDRAEPTDDQSTEDDAPATDDEKRQTPPDTTEHSPTDTTAESPEANPTDASASNTSTDDSSPSETELTPAIVPIEAAGEDESTSEEVVTDEADTDTSTRASSDDERQTETSAVDHPLIKPVAFTIADQTAVSQQQAQETTARLLPAFESPTYPPVLDAVADELDVEIDLDHLTDESDSKRIPTDTTHPPDPAVEMAEREERDASLDATYLDL